MSENQATYTVANILFQFLNHKVENVMKRTNILLLTATLFQYSQK